MPNLGAITQAPAESKLAELREAQQQALREPQTGMIVTIDIGDPANLHPKNKQDVGMRLALLAESMVYKQPVVYAGPRYRDMQINGATIRLRFITPDHRLCAKGDGPLTGFAIAGADGKFAWANAVIEGESVVVSNKDIPHPVAVRYAWGDAPQCNLYNASGLPAAPFRTDAGKEN